MIEGVLGSFFSDNHTSEDLRKAYSRVWQHLAADTLDSEDLRRISSAVDFAMKNQFCESCSRESQRVLTTVLITLRVGFATDWKPTGTVPKSK